MRKKILSFLILIFLSFGFSVSANAEFSLESSVAVEQATESFFDSLSKETDYEPIEPKNKSIRWAYYLVAGVTFTGIVGAAIVISKKVK